MARITDRILNLTHDHTKKTVRAVAKCKVKFTALEQFQMNGAPQGSFFKLKCQLWGGVGGFLDIGEEVRFTYTDVFYFPDSTSAAIESRTFDVVVGEGVLDEDLGTDEIFALFKLVNLSTLVEVKRRSDPVSHNFPS